MKNKCKILWIITSLSMIITGIAINFMEDKVPMHYDGAGKIDRWGSKYENFVFPIMIVVFSIFWTILMIYLDKKSKKAEISDKERQSTVGNAKIIAYAGIGTAILFTVMQCVILLMSYNEASKNLSSASFDLEKVIYAALGVFMVFIGNILPKSRKNSLVGIRIKWSMENDKTWSYTHRIGGVVVIICGILIIIEAMIFGKTICMWAALGLIAAATVILMAVAYRAHKIYGNNN